MPPLRPEIRNVLRAAKVLNAADLASQGQGLLSHANAPGFASAPNLSSVYITCTICLEDRCLGDEMMRILPCGHYFDKPCLLAWLNQQDFCPNCNAVVRGHTLHDPGSPEDAVGDAAAGNTVYHGSDNASSNSNDDTGDSLLYTVGTIGLGIAIAGLYAVGTIAESVGRLRSSVNGTSNNSNSNSNSNAAARQGGSGAPRAAPTAVPPSSSEPTSMVGSFLSMFGVTGGAAAAGGGAGGYAPATVGASSLVSGIDADENSDGLEAVKFSTRTLYYQPMVIENPVTPYEALTTAYLAEFNAYALTNTQINDILYIKWSLVLEILKVARCHPGFRYINGSSARISLKRFLALYGTIATRRAISPREAHPLTMATDCGSPDPYGDQLEFHSCKESNSGADNVQMTSLARGPLERSASFDIGIEESESGDGCAGNRAGETDSAKEVGRRSAVETVPFEISVTSSRYSGTGLNNQDQRVSQVSSNCCSVVLIACLYYKKAVFSLPAFLSLN